MQDWEMHCITFAAYVNNGWIGDYDTLDQAQEAIDADIADRITRGFAVSVPVRVDKERYESPEFMEDCTTVWSRD